MMQKPEVRAEEPQDDEIDLGALLGTLWANKLWIGGSSFCAVVAAIGYLAITPPTYQADALLQIESGNSSMLALSSSMSQLLGNEGSSTLAEMEILRSRQVLGRAVADLNLDWWAEPQRAPLIGHALTRYDLPIPDTGPFVAWARKGDAISLSFLEVPPDWLGAKILVEKTGQDTFTLTLPDEATLDGKVGILLADPTRGFAIQIAQLEGRPGRLFNVAQMTELSAIGKLASGLTVSERGRQTGIIDIRLNGPDRTAAMAQLNAILRAYVAQNVSKSAAEAQKSLDFVESQLPIAEAAVKKADSDLNTYRSEHNSVDLEFETQSILTEVTTLEGRLRELSLKEEELKEKYRPNHPVYRQLLDERAALVARQTELQGGITTLPETQREIVNLTRSLEVAQSTYAALMARAQELRVMSASQIGSVRIIDDAATRGSPVAPNRNRVLGLGLIVGFLLGVGGVLVRNWSRRGIDSVAEIERLGLPVFATINLYRGKVKAAEGRQPVLARDDPDDIVVEAFRSLRTSLHFGMLDATSKSLVLTSGAPGAGKSFVSANLACVAAQAGQKVCLIDADMRRGTLRKNFGMPKGLPGLADYLAETAELSSIIRDSGMANLSLITTGELPPNPSELLMRDRLKELIATLDGQFDLLIFDVPPLLAVTDAAIVGRHAGSVIAVARHNITPLGELDAVKKTLQTTGVPLKGVIFNAFDPRQMKPGGHYGYGYGYGYTNRYAYRRGGSRESG